MMRMNGCKRNSNTSTPKNAKLAQIDGSANIGYKRDRRNLSIDAMESSTDQNIDVAENRSGIERRSGKDRRDDYIEQRKSLRSKLKPGAFVYLKWPRTFKLLKPNNKRFAEILDISLTGLRAQYIATEMFKYEQDTLSIVTSDGKVKIDDIPFKIVSDNKITHLPNDTDLRRCGVKFEDISDSQKQQINQIIRKLSD
jgi:hypothetical protein